MALEIAFSSPITAKAISLVKKDDDLYSLFSTWCFHNELNISQSDQEILSFLGQFICELLELADFVENRDGPDGLEDFLSIGQPILAASIAQA